MKTGAKIGISAAVVVSIVGGVMVWGYRNRANKEVSFIRHFFPGKARPMPGT